MGSGRAGGLREQLYLFSLGLSVRLNARCSVTQQKREAVSQKCEGYYNIQEDRRIRGGLQKKRKNNQTRKIRN